MNNVSKVLDARFDTGERKFPSTSVLGGAKHLLRKSPLAVFGAVLLLLIILLGLFAPLLTPTGPTQLDLTARNKPPGWQDGNGLVHYIGTDHLGRDLLSRLLFGVRVSLVVGMMGMLVGGFIGSVLGLVSGFFGGRVDDVIMRVVDIQMSFPYILLAIILVAFLGGGLWQIIVVVGIGGWVSYTRIIRSSVLSIKEQAFVEAALAVGATTRRILFRHITPHIIAPTVIVATFQIGSVIVLESSLSFLGLGIAPPTPSLGVIISDGRRYLATAWWAVAASGALLSLIVLAINLLGDGLRDILDPRLD